MPLPFVNGVSGIRTARSTAFKRALVQDAEYQPGGVIVQGSKWYDGLNTGDVRTVRAGAIGKLTSGKIVPAFLGPVTADYTSGGTSLTVSAATANALVQAVGATGTFWLIGGALAPTTSALVLAVQVTYSAVNTTTGVITVTDIGANKAAAGSMLATFQPALLGGTGGLTTNGQALGVFNRFEGVKCIDADGNSIDVDLGEFAIGGHLDTDQVPNWPSNAFTAEVLAYNIRMSCPRMHLNHLW